MKNHTFKLNRISFCIKAVLATSLSSFSLPVWAECGINTTNGISINQVGGNCIYDVHDTYYKENIIEGTPLRFTRGATATVNLPEGSNLFNIVNDGGRLWAASDPRRYSLIYLDGDSTGPYISPISDALTTVTINGDLALYSSYVAHGRSIAIGENSRLYINGNIDYTERNWVDLGYGNNNGARHASTFSLGAAFGGTDTSELYVNGKVTAKNSYGDFVRFGKGNYTFGGEVYVTATTGPGTAMVRTDNRGGGLLTFKDKVYFSQDNDASVVGGTQNGSPTIWMLHPESSILFEDTLDIKSGLNSDKATYESDRSVIQLEVGTLSLLSNTNIDAPYLNAISLNAKNIEHNATLNNNGDLNITSKDNIAMKVNALEGATAVFNNLSNGLVNTEEANTIEVTSDHSGTFTLNNGGNLSSSTAVVDNQSENGIVEITNSGTLDGTILTTENGNTQLNNSGIWFNRKNNSNLTRLINSGAIKFAQQDNEPGRTITVSEDYQAEGKNATLEMNTVWNAPGGENGEDSESDQLFISGKASGSTTIIPVKADGTLNIIEGTIAQVNKVLNSLPVVTVGLSGETAFIGTAKTNGASEVQLAKRTINGKDEYFWTLTALEPEPTLEPIYDSRVPAYVQMPLVNMEQGYTTVGTLHERRSENHTLAWTQCSNECDEKTSQTWGRVFGRNVEIEGKKRLGFDTDIYGLQIGLDFDVKHTSTGERRLTSAYIAYSQARTDFNDKYRTVNGIIQSNKLMETGRSDAWSLGLTQTRYASNGSYLDLIAQASIYRNTYKSRIGEQVKQNGYGVLASAETGYPYALAHTEKGNAWVLEPQMQLVYQMVDLNGFHDGIRRVEQGDQHGLRGRIGLRLAHNQLGAHINRNDTFYMVANIWKDFRQPSGVQIGSDYVREKYATTWGEIGLGMQFSLSKQSYIYSDIRFEHSLGNSNHKGYRASLGLKYSW